MSKKRALLVGINEYHRTIGTLRGCVNDACRIRQLLATRYAFANEEIRLLLDATATRRAVLDGLAWLIEGASDGDLLICFYAGHGTRLPNDQDPSGKDECLVPYSTAWRDILGHSSDLGQLFSPLHVGEFFIRDKEIKSQISGVREGVNLTFVMDCCHSGDILKKPGLSTRFIEPPFSVLKSIEAAQRAWWETRLSSSQEAAPEDLKLSGQQLWTLANKVVLGNRYDFVNSSEDQILLAACSETDTASERIFNGQFSGVFSHHLVSLLTESAKALTYGQLIESVGEAMRFVPQKPRLICAAEVRMRPAFVPFT